jgi:hypothetical protein
MTTMLALEDSAVVSRRPAQVSLAMDTECTARLPSPVGKDLPNRIRAPSAKARCECSVEGVHESMLP